MKEPKIFSNQNLSEKFHYVYRVTIDEKYYIGKRSGFLNDLHTGAYKTSSELVKEKLRNGHHFSKIKILQVFSSSKDALEFEKRILTRVNARKNPKFLNQTNGSGDFSLRQHTEKTKKKISKSQRNFWNENTEIGRKNRERQKERFNIDTEEGRKNLENHRNLTLKQFDINTEEGRKNRENHRNLTLKQFDINTEQGRKRREIKSNKMKEHFNPNTEQGRKNLENHRNLTLKQFDINTEEGRKNRENHSEFMKEYFNPNTEQGRKNLEKRSQISKLIFDINTEQGRKRRDNQSNKMKDYYNTEEGKERRKRAKVVNQKSVKTRVQNRKNASILGDLMFDEDFIKENFLIIDNNNNQRFLSSVYSKLSRYCESNIRKQKRIGKLNFLSGIRSIKLSVEEENSKIEEIEAIIKSRNEKE